MLSSVLVLALLLPAHDLSYPDYAAGGLSFNWSDGCLNVTLFGAASAYRGASYLKFCAPDCPEPPVCPTVCGFAERADPLAALTRCMGGPGVKVGHLCRILYDRDGDGDVDMRDLAIIIGGVR